MKKIDLVLKLLFAVVFVGSASAQGLTPGGVDCESATPITIGSGWVMPACGDQWYSFTAPCDGEFNLSDCAADEGLALDLARSNERRIYTSTCDALVLETTTSWTTCSTTPVALEAGETAYVQIIDQWSCDNSRGDYSFSVEFDDPDCPAPTSPEAIPTEWDEAMLAWFGDSDLFDVVYGPVGFDPETEGTWIEDVPGDGSSAFMMLDGLAQLTCYEYYVYSVCDGIRGCVGTKSQTFCTPAICPIPEYIGEFAITNTTTKLEWDQGASEDEWDVSYGFEGYEIEGVGEIGFLGGYDVDHEYDLTGLDPATCYDWYVRSVCYEDLDEDGSDETYYSLWVGPNEWCTNANCLDPTDGTMIASGGLTATLEWEANNDPEESEWNLQYGEPGFELGTGVTITNVPTNPFTVPGLTPGTDYCFYVQAVCGEGPDSLSGWTGPYCFTTSTFCEMPSGLGAAPSSPSETGLSWVENGDATSWEVSWGAGIDDPMDGSIETTDVFPSLALTGLTAGEDYCYFVRANCGMGADSASAWAGPYCWSQPPLCATPHSLNVLNITNTAAHINFVATGGENYDIEWGAPCFEPEMGDEAGSVAGTTDLPYYMTGMTPSTPYWAYVRSNCGVDSVSAWAGPILFGTDITNDNPCGAEELVMGGEQIVRHNFEATVLPGETGIAPEADDCYGNNGWCSGDGVDRSVWFKFTAPASGRAKISTFDPSECVTNGYTEIAVYSSGDCGVIGGFTPIYANSLADDATEPPYGSEVIACGLTPGQEYYVMVNPISYIQPEVHFGITLSEVEEISAGLGLSPTICAGSSYDLFNAIAGESAEDGTWYNPTVAPGNEISNEVVFPDEEGSFDLYYVLDNGCDADTVMTVVSTNEGLSAGNDGFYTACNDYPIVLSDHLGGSHDGGGIWEYVGVDEDVALAGGLFNTLGMGPGTYPFLYTVANEYCPTDSAWVYVTLFDCAGTDEETQNELMVYPNPVEDVLTVQNLNIDGNAVIEVLDVEGRIVISNTVGNVYGPYLLDMSAVESGVYIVKVTSESAEQKVRVIKQ
ncbi:T9SS type A sorting domain-containing protein [Crocinitomix algicola]|uniref:T9SS type A sorting domain-containing protein n=1 Tax=Crocinitomix algicola TaxID=1740263 RepID=UPI0008343FC0|nr:fibronectin type III domain-containing protein [Crocinitomix algicola]